MSRKKPSCETIIDGISTAVLAINQDLNVIYANEAAEFLLDMSLKKTKKRSLLKCFINPSDLTYMINEALHWQRSFSEYSLELVNTRGKMFYTDCYVTPFQKDLVLLEMVETQHRHHINQQEQIKRMQEASSLLIQGLAHEIRNPLTGLKGAAQLLKKHHNKEIAPYLDIFTQEIDRLNNLLNKTLAENPSPNKKENVNIHQILHHISHLMKNDTNKHIVFSYDYDPSIPDINADEEQLTQVLINIIRNAIQAIKETGRIKLSTRIHSASPISLSGKSMLNIRIHDNGSGIAREIQDKIFIPMVTTKAQGTGVGLSISHDIIRQHQGSIHFESSPGNTVFNVYLPLK